MEEQTMCAICHENMENHVHTLPECNHKFHTNCIMTWFRAPSGNKRCPLCNNQGINTHSDINTSIEWHERESAMLNYVEMRRFSRKKIAPQKLKNMVKKLKKMEETDKKRRKDFIQFKKSKFSDQTAGQLHTTYCRFRRGKWRNRRNIRRQKLLIGFQQNVVNIIIPVKQIV